MKTKIEEIKHFWDNEYRRLFMKKKAYEVEYQELRPAPFAWKKAWTSTRENKSTWTPAPESEQLEQPKKDNTIYHLYLGVGILWLVFISLILWLIR